MFYAMLPIRAQIVKPQTVFFGINLRNQPVLKLCPLCRIDDTLKHRILDPLSEVLAGAGNPAQTALPARVGCCDIIAHDYEHSSSLPHKRRIAIEVSPQVPGHKDGLDVGQKTDGHLLINKGMQYFLLLAFLISNEYHLSGIVVHPDGP